MRKKKSYRIKFNKKTSLFNLEAAKSWVLIAQYRDATLLYNTTAFELGNRFTLPFNHSYNFVELYLNGEYAGNYLLTEQNQVGKGRVDIDENQGWFIEMDGYYDEEPKFRTDNYNLPVMIKSPESDPEDITNPAFDFVRNELNSLTDSMASSNFPENGYRDLIDMNTFIDFLMITEICDNKEILSPMSTYLYKDKDGLISMGPLWDFDCGYGYNYNYVFYNSPESRTPMHKFFKRFFEDPVFLVKYKERWNDKFDEITSIPDFMDEKAILLRKSAEQNFQSWWYKTYAPWTDNKPSEPNDFLASISSLRNYYQLHTAYLNSEINKVDVLPTSRKFTTYALDYDFNPQTFTLVAYGDITNLQATLRKTDESNFEISAEIDNNQATDDGGYFATVYVKPKKNLSVPTSDVLIITGNNQGNSFLLEIPLSFEVENPIYTIPTDLVAIYGQTLADIILPDGWNWMDNTLSVGDAGEQTHQLKYTLRDLTVFNIDVDVTIEKATPEYILPDNLTAIYGQTLADVELPAGWEWEDETTIVGSAGQQVHLAKFTPADTENYNIINNIGVSIAVTDIVTNIGEQHSILKAWMRNDILHIAGITIGKTLSIYDISGKLIYHSISTTDEVDIPLSLRKQTIFIRSGKSVIKVVCI